MNEYFLGTKLYGDDFNINEIEEWYKDEKEGYSDLVISQGDNHIELDGYETMNNFYGFKYLPKEPLEKVLGFGAALGFEFKPISNLIKELYIIEPSDHLVSTTIFGLNPQYKKPTIQGNIEFSDNSFDLITCFGVLHHIPNVSYVFNEMHRCLKPGGRLILREPINSMGDWNKSRPGLTKRERGIPLAIFRKLISELNYEVEHEYCCGTMIYFFQKKIGKFFSKPLHYYILYILIDRFLSLLFARNYWYHPKNKLERIGPTFVYYVLRKK